MSQKKISAAAVSRILNSAGVKKALTGTSYSTGFEVIGLEVLVQVHYTPRSIDDQATELKRIADLLNGHKSGRYEAKVAGTIVEVRIHVEDPEAEKEARIEKLAEEAQYGVTKAEVRKVIEPGRYEHTEWAAGYLITREPSPNDRLVRVTYRDHEHTAYAYVEGGRDKYSHDAVNGYAKDLVEAGYSVQIGFEDGEDYVLVGTAGEFQAGLSQEEESEAAQEPLRALREAIEAKALSYMTRKAGPTSIFVYYLVPFKDKLRRLEVFHSGGCYASYGRFGGPARHEFFSLDSLVRFIHSEIAD